MLSEGGKTALPLEMLLAPYEVGSYSTLKFLGSLKKL